MCYLLSPAVYYPMKLQHVVVLAMLPSTFKV